MMKTILPIGVVLCLSLGCGSSTTDVTSPPSVSSLVQGTLSIASSGTTGVDRSTAFTLTFSEAVTSSTVSTSTITLACGSAHSIAVAAVTSGSTSAAFTLTPLTAMPAITVCTLSVGSGITNASGTAVTTKNFSFTTASSSTSPSVSSLTQGSTTIAASGTTDVDRSAAFTLTFSQAMLSSTVSTSSVTLTCSSSQTLTIAAVSSGDTSAAFTLTPSSAMPASTSCTLAVGSGATNASGTAVAEKSFVFTTASAGTPTVSLAGTLLSSGASSTIATSGTTGISGATSAPLTMTFSTAMSNSTVTSGTTFQCPSGTTLTPTLASSDNTIYTITPTAALPQMSSCVLNLANTIQNASGSALAATSYTYQTGCSTTDDFSNSATFSSSSTICWTPTNAGNASTFAISDGSLVIATSTSTTQATQPTAAKTFPIGAGTITVTALLAYSGISDDSSDRCTLEVIDNINNYATATVFYNGDEAKVTGLASDGAGGEITSNATSTSPIYLKIAISGGTAVVSYSSNGTTYNNLVTNGVYGTPTTTSEVNLSARSNGSGTTTCTFQDFTVTGATATGQY